MGRNIFKRFIKLTLDHAFLDTHTPFVPILEEARPLGRSSSLGTDLAAIYETFPAAANTRSGLVSEALSDETYKPIWIPAHFDFSKTALIDLESESYFALQLQDLRTTQIALT